MANCVVIGFKHPGQSGRFSPRFGIRTRGIGGLGMKFLAMSMFAAMMLAAVPARAASITGYDLYRQCTAIGDSEDAASDRLSCAAYLAGYLDGAYQVSRLNRLSPVPIQACPGDIAVGQYLLVFQRWAEQHPQWLSRSAPDVLAAALVNAFPCSPR
jgi:Rap1a immunity proteins